MINKNKRGVSLVILAVTIIVALALLSTIVISYDKIKNSTKKREFAREIYTIQKLSDEYYFKNNKLPTGAEHSFSNVEPECKSQFDGDDIAGSIYRELDLYSLGVENVARGAKKDGDNSDVYVVSETTRRVYYLKGYEVAGYKYYTLTNELKKLVQSNEESDEQNPSSPGSGSAMDAYQNPSKYYGKKVNYSANEISDWKIFHSDGTNIYLISSDYIPVNKLPIPNNGQRIVNTNSTYPKGAPLTNAGNALGYVSGTGSIASDNPARKWLSTYLNSYTSDNLNIRAVAYLIDTKIWKTFVNEAYADYAIGGPTIDMFFSSYNKLYKVNYQAKVVGIGGYKVSADGNNFVIQCNNMFNKNDSLYVLPLANGAYGMWVASPTYVNSNYDDVITVNNDGMLNYFFYQNNASYPGSIGYRPIVCLKSSAKLVETSNGFNLE